MKLENNVELLEFFVERELFGFAEKLCLTYFNLEEIIKLRKTSECLEIQEICLHSLCAIKEKISNKNWY